MRALSAVRWLLTVQRLFFTYFVDLMWSDPDEIENWAVSPRGAGWLFGGSVTEQV